MTADKILDRLVELGCQESSKKVNTAHMEGIGRWVYFDPVGRKPRKDELPKLCQAVRAAALKERSRELIADIDRMGRVIGWHIGSAPF